jgi:hypothetical protein
VPPVVIQTSADIQCYTIDCLMSINHGQRSAIPLENIETLMPTTGATMMHKLKYEVRIRAGFCSHGSQQYMRTVKTSVIDIVSHITGHPRRCTNHQGCRPDSAPASWEQISAVHRVLMQYE